jgi:zinc-ribbon domain
LNLKELSVAIYCTKCGTQLPPDTQFCTACGAAVTAPTAVVSPEYPAPPPPYTQPYAQPVPPPPSGNSAVKIILIVVSVFVGLGILAVCVFAFTIWRVSKAVRVEGDGSKVSVTTPGGGNMSVNAEDSYSASDLGTDIYPGASKGHGGMKMDLPTGSMVTGIFLTSDSKDKVLAFYKDKLGSSASIMDTSDTAIVSLKKGENEVVMVTISPHKGESDNQTQLTIMHTKKTGNN